MPTLDEIKKQVEELSQKEQRELALHLIELSTSKREIPKTTPETSKIIGLFENDQELMDVVMESVSEEKY